VFTPDDYLNSFDYRLNKYIEDNFPEENWNSAKKTFNKLKDLTSEQYIIDNYLNK
jgi:hypothetical protein